MEVELCSAKKFPRPYTEITSQVRRRCNARAHNSIALNWGCYTLRHGEGLEKICEFR
jgi:hypothetical protein